MWEGTGKRKMKMSIEMRVEHELDSQEVSECLLNALLLKSFSNSAVSQYSRD